MSGENADVGEMCYYGQMRSMPLNSTYVKSTALTLKAKFRIIIKMIIMFMFYTINTIRLQQHMSLDC